VAAEIGSRANINAPSSPPRHASAMGVEAVDYDDVYDSAST
jgi:hypothetical protein